MNYKPYLNWEEFLKRLLETIDLRRTMILLNNPDFKFVTSKSKTIKKTLTNNFQYLFPDSVYQENSNVTMNFTRLEPKVFASINDFWFVGINVYSVLCAPVYIILYFDENENPCYYVPMNGNTYNTVTDHPFGVDLNIDHSSCKNLCGCTIEELSKNPSRYQNFDIMMKDLKETLGLPEYSMVNEVDLKENIENLFEFTRHNKEKNEELL